jgi:hypothetical protein
MLAAATFSAGGIGIVFIIAVFQASSAPPAEIVLPMLYFLLALPASVCTIVFRSRFLRLPRTNQLAIAYISVAATALALVYLVHNFR